MSKLQDIRNLVQEHAVSVSSSPGDWMDYMDTASRLYRYFFFRPASDPCTASRRNSLCITGTME